MFINPTVFKKIIKNSWSREGLTVGATEEEIFLAGGCWVIRAYKTEMQKKIKAAVIELIGDFPRTGEVFTCYKKKSTQYEIAENEYWNITERFVEAQVPLNVTKIQYTDSWANIRILQEEKTKQCTAINDIFWKLLDVTAREAMESPPEGPVTDFLNTGLVYWQNETMTLAVGRIDMKGSKELEYFMEHMGQQLLPAFQKISE